MNWLQVINYKIWLFWQGLKLISLFKSVFSVMGALWLIIEILAFFNKDTFSENLKSIWWLFLITGFVWVLIENRPKSKHSYSVKNKDVIVTIQIGDIFKTNGAIIIPINNKFDVSNSEIISKSSSILKTFIKKEYGNSFNHLKTDIEQFIEERKDWYSSYQVSTNPNLFKIGTVIPIFRNDKQYYLLSNSMLNEQSRSKCTEEDLKNSLIELWAYLTSCGSKDNLVIPIIGTGRGRIPMKREDVIKEIILSFLVSLSADTYCEQLTICIHPSDIMKYKINIKGIIDFTELHCLNANFSRPNENQNANIGESIT